MVGSILIGHPLEDLLSSLVIEVDINIRERDAVGIEEPLKEEIVSQWIKVGDGEGVGDDRACSRASTRTDDDPELSCIDDVVLHDQEVAREAHRLDHTQLVVQPLLHLVRELLSVSLLRSLVGEMPEVVVGIGKALRDREVRHQRVAVDGVDLHLVEDLGGVAECLRDIGEDFIHLLGTLEPLLLGVSKPIGVVKGFARAEADQSLVRLAIFLVGEVGVIRGDQLHALLCSKLDEHLIYLLLLLVGLSIAAFLVCLVPLQL